MGLVKRTFVTLKSLIEGENHFKLIHSECFSYGSCKYPTQCRCRVKHLPVYALVFKSVYHEPKSDLTMFKD